MRVGQRPGRSIEMRARALAGLLWLLCCVVAAGPPCARAAQATPAGSARVGSKNFTESLVLADILQLLAQRRGLRLVQQRAMGGTAILWQALLRDAIDVYPEYTGTLTQELLHAVPAL